MLLPELALTVVTLEAQVAHAKLGGTSHCCCCCCFHLLFMLLLLQLALSVVSLEAQVARLAELLANVISDTKGRVEKKQAQVHNPAHSGQPAMWG